ncbi:MAG: Ig-like domain-containing protein, partial [Marinicella sp.]
MLLLCVTSAQSQTELCVTPSIPGEWDLQDLATQDIPITLDAGDVGDAFTTAYTVRSAEFRLIHTYSGDLGGRLISPDNTNVHLWQLGNGTIPPSTGSGGSSCNEGGYDIEFSDTGGGVNLTIANENVYCTGNTDYTVASGSGVIGDPYVFNVSNPGDPAIQGIATPIDPLSNFNGDNINGTWIARITDGYAQDVGAITEVCLDVTFAGVDHQFFVSSDANCIDELDTNSFAHGDTFYICQNVVNRGTETFQVAVIGDTSNDVGTDLSALLGNYGERNDPTATKTVANSFTAGSGIFTVGTNTFNSSVTVTGTDTNFTISDTLTAPETITITVAPAAPVINSPTNGAPVSGTGEPGATVTVSTPSGSSCTTTVQVGGSWSCTLSPSPIDGENISAFQELPVGNISPTTTVTNGIDTTAPTTGTCSVTPDPANDNTALVADCDGFEAGSTVTIP